MSMTQDQVNFMTSPAHGRKLKGASFVLKPFETLKHRVTVRIDTMNWNIATRPLLMSQMSFQVIMQDHQQFFANSF